MNEHYLIFRHFISLEEATSTLKILEANQVPGEVKFSEGQLDNLLTGDRLNPKYELRIATENFQKADSILNQLAEKDLENYEIDPDYYLYTFTDRELLNVIIQVNEWSSFDVALARNILKERNIAVSEEVIEVEKQLHLGQLFEPEKAKDLWIFLGYLFAFVGGFLGFLIGSTFYYAKKVLPDGSKVPVYDENTRKHAFQIFIISLIIFPVTLLLQVWLNILEVL